MVLGTTGKFPWNTQSLYAYGFSNSIYIYIYIYIYDYISKLCRQQAQVIKNHENSHIRNIGQGEANTENIRGLNLAVRRTTDEVTKLQL
jgi:hypothetical protein